MAVLATHHANCLSITVSGTLWKLIEDKLKRNFSQKGRAKFLFPTEVRKMKLTVNMYNVFTVTTDCTAEFFLVDIELSSTAVLCRSFLGHSYTLGCSGTTPPEDFLVYIAVTMWKLIRGKTFRGRISSQRIRPKLLLSIQFHVIKLRVKQKTFFLCTVTITIWSSTQNKNLNRRQKIPIHIFCPIHLLVSDWNFCFTSTTIW